MQKGAYPIMKLAEALIERAEIQNRKIVGAIRSAGRGGCYALYFMVENRGREWYNQGVKDINKPEF